MKRAFEVKQREFFIIFKRLSICKNFHGPESAPLKNYSESNFLLKNIESYFIVRREKRQFVRIYLLVENRLNGKLYSLNIYHPGFKNSITNVNFTRQISKFTAS